MSLNVVYWIGGLLSLTFGLSLLGLWWRQSRILEMLESSLASRDDLDQDRELLQQQLEERLREMERGYLRVMAENRSHIVERLIRSHHLQQKSGQDLQQQLLGRFSKLYQALERRFGEMHRDLTEDGGRLRTELLERFESLQKATFGELNARSLAQQRTAAELREGLLGALQQHRQSWEERQGAALKAQQDNLREGMEAVVRQVSEALSRHADDIGRQVKGLTATTDQRLKEISGQVDKRLEEGFRKTTETFTRVLTHLSRIDEAQKKITELSGKVVSLQDVLTDKRSRGAFGEVQLQALVRNLMPASSFSLQHGLPNQTRVDCMLFLPEPTGNVCVDAKFPLEGFRRMIDPGLSSSSKKKTSARFRADIRKHIRDIADKYIIPGETADGAVMFIPAEAVFAEIYARFPDLVEESYRRRVWMVSPTTMMAILTTARAVLKDVATREQVDIIQEHLHELARDFGRFQQRMDNLARHIHQASRDVEEVNLSARKISGRFAKIEQAELDEAPKNAPPLFEARPGPAAAQGGLPQSEPPSRQPGE